MSEPRVVVVGAGPAGAAAAITCAEAGLTVDLLDASARPVDRPGETLHPGVELVFRRLGVDREVESAGFLRHEGVRVSWAGAPRFEPYGADASGPWRGYQAWRATLDGLLRARAEALGVRTLFGCRVRGPVLRAGRVAGVLSDRGPIEATWVVDASGARRVIARAVGLAARPLTPRLVARYGYVSGPRDAEPSLAADPRGWTWRAEVRPGLHQWTRLDFGPRSDVTIFGRPVARSRGADVSWRLCDRAAGPGLFVVGDAAAVLDPASSHGVLRALMSGVQAARAIVVARSGALSARAATEGYTGWLRSWVGHDAAKLRALYGSLPEPPAWARGASSGLDRGHAVPAGARPVRVPPGPETAPTEVESPP